MKTSNQLSKYDTCKNGAAINLSTVSPGQIRAGCIKSITKRMLMGEPITDIKGELMSILASKGYKWENNTQKDENIEKYTKIIKEYVDYENSASDRTKIYLDGVNTVCNVFGEEVDVKPDFIIDYGDDTYGIAKLTTGKCRGMDPNNFEDYALGQLGKKLFPDKIVYIEHIGLDINNSSMISNQNYSNAFMFSRSVEIAYETAHAELEKDDHECSPAACQTCAKNNICHYEEPAIAMQIADIVRPVDVQRLTNAQRQVIDYEFGIARVNAGAGAGKTLVVAERVAELLTKGYNPEDFCLLTFTKAGAEEMTARVMSYAAAKGIALNPDNFSSGTINGFCQTIVEQYYTELGFTRKPRIIPDQIKYQIIQDIVGNKMPKISCWNYGFCQDMKKFNPFARKVAINEAYKLFSLIKEGEITKDNILDHYDYSRFKSEDVDTIFTAYDMYEKELLRRNLCEFSDQLRYTMKIYENHPDLFENLGYKHIIIDEFQDTDLKQIQLLQQMIDTQCFRSFMAVGDDSQSIFAFRHTSPEYMINFGEYFGENFDDFPLVENHRSNKATIDFANQVNELANEKVAKDLIPTKEEGIKPIIRGCYSKKEEYEFITNSVKEHWDAGNRDIAILAPTKKELKEIASILTQKGIPSIMMCALPFVENSRVAALLTFYDSFFKGSTQGFADYKNVLVHGAFKNVSSEIIDNEVEKFKIELTDETRNLKNFMKFAKALDESEIDACYQEFISQLSFCENTEELKEFMEAFKLYGDRSEYTRQGRYEGVSLNTIHSSKGLEWDTVYLTMSNFDKANQHSRSYRSSKDHDEQIRKWFVGSTRARKEYIMSGEYLLSKPNARTGTVFNQYVQKAYEMLGRAFGYNYQSYRATVEAEIQEAKEEAIKNMTAFAVPQVETRQSRTNEQQLEIGE